MYQKNHPIIKSRYALNSETRVVMSSLCSVAKGQFVGLHVDSGLTAL